MCLVMLLVLLVLLMLAAPSRFRMRFGLTMWLGPLRILLNWRLCGMGPILMHNGWFDRARMLTFIIASRLIAAAWSRLRASVLLLLFSWRILRARLLLPDAFRFVPNRVRRSHRRFVTRVFDGRVRHLVLGCHRDVLLQGFPSLWAASCDTLLVPRGILIDIPGRSALLSNLVSW